MALYHSSDIAVSTCVELAPKGHLTYEVDPDNDRVNFSFGYSQDYQLELCTDDLRRMIELGTEALAEIVRVREAEEAACAVS